MPATLRKRFHWLAPAIAVLISASCSHKPGEETPVRKLSPDTLNLSVSAMKNITLKQAQLSEFPEGLTLMGRISVTEDRTAVMPARVSGRIDSVFVSSGEQVSRGQALASLFSPDYVVAQEEYVQALKQNQSIEGARLVDLAEQKLQSMGLDRSDIVQIRSDHSEHQPHLVVRATRNGIILDKKAIVGNFVNVGDTLFTVADLAKVWFAGDIYPEDLPKVHKDQEVVIESEFSNQPILGKVSFISPVVDPTTRTIKIRALMDNPGLSLRADMYVKGTLTLSRKTALLVPTSAILHLQDGTYCFKKTGDRTFKRVRVEVSRETENQAVVAAGIANGEEVVSDGGLLLDAALTESGS